MKILLISIGTRGDMEPFLAIGELFKENGHHVICAFPEQFRSLVEESGLNFFSLGEKFIDMLESDDGKVALGGAGYGLKKFSAYIKLAGQSIDINKELVHKQYELIERERPDRIVYNGKALVPVIWSVKNPGKITFISPLPYMHYVKDHTHIVFNSNYGAFLNRITFALADFGTITTIMLSKRWLNISEKISRKQIKNAYFSNKVIYAVSPSLFQRPEYWKKNLQVLGFQEKRKSSDWRPDQELLDFLNRHDNVIFITFGSMTNPNPEQKTRILLDVLRQHNIPAIINTASGGLVKPHDFRSEHIHFVSYIPYDWIFPKMHAVIHHGGAGTTHLALKYGCATMIIPHIIDQFVWNKIIHRIGAGPLGIRIDNISLHNVEKKIIELINNQSYKNKATLIAAQMATESFENDIYSTIVEAE